MEPYVKHVLNLWKKAYTETDSQKLPYKISQQLKNLAALFAPGSCYYYIIDFPNLEFEYISGGTKNILGIAPENITMEYLVGTLVPEERVPMAQKESVAVDFFLNYLHPEEVLFYKSVYFFRIQDMKEQYHDMLHQASVLTLTEHNKPKHVMVVHTDVSHLNFIRKNSISFISLKGDKSYYDVDIEQGIFEPHTENKINVFLQDILTSREKEIARLLAQGMNADTISEKLFISVHTIRTHRKNMLSKASCKNTTELVARCLVEGVI